MSRQWPKWLLGALALLLADRGLAHLCVATNVAGALLSPGGATLEALGIALAFLLARLGFVLCFALGVGLLAARALSGLARRVT